MRAIEPRSAGDTRAGPGERWDGIEAQTRRESSVYVAVGRQTRETVCMRCPHNMPHNHNPARCVFTYAAEPPLERSALTRQSNLHCGVCASALCDCALTAVVRCTVEYIL